METLWRDIRYAVRSLARTPGFTVAAVLTLALGIGANAAIFSVFDAVLLRPLPYRDADRLYVIHEGVSRLIPANALHFREWRASTRTFEEMALIGGMGFTLRGVGQPAVIQGARVTPSPFRMLGAEPILGRGFTEQEDAEGNDRTTPMRASGFSPRSSTGSARFPACVRPASPTCCRSAACRAAPSWSKARTCHRESGRAP
jgi:hypothetical protein